jgi:hypothetical protein
LDLDFCPHLHVRLVIVHLLLAANSSFSPRLGSSTAIHFHRLNPVFKSSSPSKTIFEAQCLEFVLFRTLHFGSHQSC